jgi:hypothetical protein
MSVASAILLLAGMQAREYYQEGDEPPFKLAGVLLEVEAIHTHFGDEPRLEDASGVKGELQVRLGEDYYYRVAGYGWRGTKEEDRAGGEDVDLWAWAVGLGMDWTFGAFEHFSLDAGGGVGILYLDAETDSEKGWFIQIEAAPRFKITDHFGLRVSGSVEFANLHFNTAETEHTENYTIGAGLEISF